MLPQERADAERATKAVVGALGAQVFTSLLEQGRRMSVQEAADAPAAEGDATLRSECR